MSNMGIPVPPGFTITTEVCNYFTENKKFPDNLETEIKKAVHNLESFSDKSFGSAGTPLLLSVRSGGRISMPGMMDSILNIGLNDANVSQLAEAFNDERFALDSYRRLLMNSLKKIWGDLILIKMFLSNTWMITNPNLL